MGDITSYIDNPPVALLIIALIAAVTALASGKLVVPRFVYDKEVKNGEVMIEQLSKMTKLLEDYNDINRDRLREDRDRR